MSVYHGGDVWRGPSPDVILDFSANLNPEGPPEWVRAAMLRGLENARYYPDLRQAAALAGLSAHLGLPEACVLPTAGGIEAAACVAKRLDNHAVIQPTFQEYGALCGGHRDVLRSELADYRPLTGETLWLCNPNNPTGDALPRPAVLALLERLEVAGGRLVVDEAFIDYCPEHSVRGAVADADAPFPAHLYPAKEKDVPQSVKVPVSRAAEKSRRIPELHHTHLEKRPARLRHRIASGETGTPQVLITPPYGPYVTE